MHKQRQISRKTAVTKYNAYNNHDTAMVHSKLWPGKGLV